MEVMPAFGETDATGGTSMDHIKLGLTHLSRAVELAFTRKGNLVAPTAQPPAAAPTSSQPPASGGDDSEDKGDDKYAKRKGIILPTESWKEGWDTWVLLLILYSAVMVPYRICFDDEAVGAMFLFEQTVTFTFITDVYFNFNTACATSPPTRM